MPRKRHIVSPDGRDWACWVAGCVLGADEGREIHGGGGCEIGHESEGVDGGETEAYADRGVPTKIKNRLRIAG